MNLATLNSNTQTANTQAQLTPEMALDLLIEGNARFVQKKPLNRDLLQQVDDTSTGQFPFATVLSCIDSRVSSEIIFDQGIGDIFSVRIAGNFVNSDILGSMEFASKLAGTKLILVLGHTSCGAVKGACDHAKLGNLTAMLDKIMPAVTNIQSEFPQSQQNSSHLPYVNKVAKENVLLTMARIRQESPILADMEQKEEIQIKGGMYHIDSGRVEIY